MDVDGLFADVERLGDGPVGEAAGHESGNFGFARGEPGEGVMGLARAAASVQGCGALAQGGTDDVEQMLVAEGFFQKVEGALLHGLHGQFHVSVTGEEDDGDLFGIPAA